MNLRSILQRIPDPRGKQGQDYRLWSIFGLIVVSTLCGRRGMKAAFLLGRSLNRRQRAELGFPRDRTPCHATLTETLRVLDPHALAEVRGSLYLETNGEAAASRSTARPTELCLRCARSTVGGSAIHSPRNSCCR